MTARFMALYEAPTDPRRDARLLSLWWWKPGSDMAGGDRVGEIRLPHSKAAPEQELATTLNRQAETLVPPRGLRDGTSSSGSSGDWSARPGDLPGADVQGTARDQVVMLPS
ncbi:hypothetical protein [Streptomyces sp. NPDC059994]|uniref:hypothetical protein n=1 Tax=Streptomyces sp. NPDC059994 TaxID=3347029 RepID=UPI0036957002